MDMSYLAVLPIPTETTTELFSASKLCPLSIKTNARKAELSLFPPQSVQCMLLQARSDEIQPLLPILFLSHICFIYHPSSKELNSVRMFLFPFPIYLRNDAML